MKTIKHSPTLTEYIYEDSDGTVEKMSDKLTDEEKKVQIAEIIGVVEEDE